VDAAGDLQQVTVFVQRNGLPLTVDFLIPFGAAAEFVAFRFQHQRFFSGLMGVSGSSAVFAGRRFVLVGGGFHIRLDVDM